MHSLDSFRNCQPWHQWLILYLLSLPGIGRRSVIAMLVEILNNQIKPDAIWEWGSAQKSFLILFKNIDKLPKISEIEQFYISTLREAKKSNASVIIMGSEEFPVQLYSSVLLTPAVRPWDELSQNFFVVG